MVKFYITALMFAIASALPAQYYYIISLSKGNPGNLNTDLEYPVGGGLTTGWTVIHDGNAPSAPQWSSVRSIPFTFYFNGSAVTHYKVSTSGILTFDTSAISVPAYGRLSLPNAGVPDKSVCITGISSLEANDKIVTKTFGTAPNRQHWIFFSSYSNTTVNCWTYWSIVLEESTNRIHIVDQRNVCANSQFSLGIQINSTTAVMVAPSPNLSSKATTNPAPDDNEYYTFIQGTQPQLDAAGASIINPDIMALTQAPFTLSASFANFGSATITSATINYQINSSAIVSAPLSNLNFSSMSIATFNHPTPWNPGSSANYTVKMWLSAINGQPDQNNSNDTITKVINVVPALVQRRPLMEVFSSSTCPPCAPANASFHSLMNQQPPGNFTVLKYQMSWPGTGDPYYTPEAGDRRTFYGVNSVPNMQIDGGWNQHAGQATQAIIDQFRAVPSFVNITASSSLSGQTVNAQISVTPVANISGNIRLIAAIKETQTTQNVKTNGETIFYDVFKKFLTPTSAGQVITNLNAGTTQNFNFSYTFNGSYILPPNATQPVNHATNHTVENFQNLRVVVWLQDMTTKQILQSTQASHSTIGLSEYSASSITLYPNPTRDQLTIDHTALSQGQSFLWQIISISGQPVLSGSAPSDELLKIDVSSLPSGLYLFEFSDGKETIRKKFQKI
ncbi:MAG: T9SS type A sorting domain-containing protein [Thermaurantimonas sp.]